VGANKRPRFGGVIWRNLLPKRKLPYIVYDISIIALRDNNIYYNIIITKYKYFSKVCEVSASYPTCLVVEVSENVNN
jgi:hypothetical protein